MSKQTLILIAACSLLAGPVLDQPGPPPGGPPPGDQGGDDLAPGVGPERGPPSGPRKPREVVFISPAGEPFRAPPGSAYPVAEWFARADANHDGVVTRDEFVADSLSFFDKLDADHDGILDGFEVADYEQKVAPEILPRAAQFQEDRWGSLGGGLASGGGPPRGRGRALFGKGAPQGYGAGRSGAGLYGLLNEVEPVSGSDGDLDHHVTRQEFAKAAKMRFDLLDPQKTGALKLSDLPKTPLQNLLENPPKDKKRRKPPQRVEMRLQSSAATTP